MNVVDLTVDFMGVGTRKFMGLLLVREELINVIYLLPKMFNLPES